VSATARAKQVARELGVDPADRDAMGMIECGLHSGLPRCCVAFFVKVWWPYWLAIDGLSSRARTDAHAAFAAYQRWTTRPGYVPCPRCVVDENFVEVLPCECELKLLTMRDRS
jgi:hypothetical protein